MSQYSAKKSEHKEVQVYANGELLSIQKGLISVPRTPEFCLDSVHVECSSSFLGLIRLTDSIVKKQKVIANNEIYLGKIESACFKKVPTSNKNKITHKRLGKYQLRICFLCYKLVKIHESWDKNRQMENS